VASFSMVGVVYAMVFTSLSVFRKEKHLLYVLYNYFIYEVR